MHAMLGYVFDMTEHLHGNTRQPCRADSTMVHGMMLQGYVLPTLALLSYLKRDGSYYHNPWLIQPTSLSQTTDSRQHQTSDHARQPSPHDSQPSPEPDPQQLPAAASARLSQSSAAELAQATPLQDATSTDATSAEATDQQTQRFSDLMEELEAHQQWQENLVQAAAALVSDSPFHMSRFQGMAWLAKLVPQLTEQGCTAVANSAAVMASVSVIQRESESTRTRIAAVQFCWSLHTRGALPVAALLEARVHQHLALLAVQSGQPDPYLRLRETMCHLFSLHALVRVRW